MPKIKNIRAREILDSRGWPTIEAKVILDNGIFAKASVPGGTSRGFFEACELRDNDHKRYEGRGVLIAVNKVNEIIAQTLIGQEITKQVEIDNILIKLDGTTNKSSLGANSILAVSLACARTGALAKKQELFEYLKDTYLLSSPKIPVPIFNIFNGGKHADTNLDFQEFLFIPRAQEASRMIQMGAEVFQALGQELREAGYDTDTGLEGGYAPDMNSSIDAIEFILAAAVKAGYQSGKDFNLGIDIGSSALYEKNTKRYIFQIDNSYFSSANLIGLYNEWLKKYPIVYLEDALAEDEWEDWRELTSELGDKMLIVGDDLFATNQNRLRQGFQEKAGNSIVIKPNQIGTLTEAIECIKLAQKHGYKVIVSHRSGETNDDFISDLAVASGADYLKAGSLSRGERLAKYNRLTEVAGLIK